MAFKDLAEVLDNTLQIPYKGKTYTIQGVSAETGRWFVALTAAGYELAVLQERARIKDAELTEDTEFTSLDEDSERILREGKNRDFNREALGDALDEMEDDGLSAAQIHHIAQTVLMWTVNGREMAESYYNSGGKAPAPNREQRRTATRTRTGAATTTRKAGSATTTSTRKGTARATRGGTSSSTGR